MKVTFDNINKSFFSVRGKIDALNEINFEIKDKEFFVLLGPSGCGKTTLLNLVAGLEKASWGKILFDDTVVLSVKKKIFKTPKERNVAFVFQSYALYPHLNVYENIAFPLRITHTKESRIKELVSQATATLNISDLVLAKPAELSGGQKQRVAIARAIVRKPDIFLMDEPLSNLDAQLRISMRSEIKNLQRKLGVTTLYVTHDQVEAISLGDRIAVLREGKIEQIGTPHDLYKRPANTFVARFIGSPPMNLFEGTWKEEQDGCYIFAAGQKLKIPNELSATLKKYKTDSFIFGIRPEDIKINPSYVEQLVMAKIYSIEPMGKETNVNLVWGEQKLSVLTQDTEFKEGQIVALQFDFPKMNIFEKDN